MKIWLATLSGSTYMSSLHSLSASISKYNSSHCLRASGLPPKKALNSLWTPFEYSTPMQNLGEIGPTCKVATSIAGLTSLRLLPLKERAPHANFGNDLCPTIWPSTSGLPVWLNVPLTPLTILWKLLMMLNNFYFMQLFDRPLSAQNWHFLLLGKMGTL